jgi:hypothetical protein
VVKDGLEASSLDAIHNGDPAASTLDKDDLKDCLIKPLLQILDQVG